MLELARQKQAIVRQDISKEDALKMFGERGEEYKCELISELEDGQDVYKRQVHFTRLDIKLDEFHVGISFATAKRQHPIDARTNNHDNIGFFHNCGTAAQSAVFTGIGHKSLGH